ncbi:uncharacterized protein LOC133284874 [Gastrolobium bilobum]|uniref:uncharacterized protein LOC133284874 n=1 Tax=Gastrolobium bilobum TaxID=150636 RepID=UPI002AAFBFA0|nr:uncharacterized protein LOC133284874 [Gastrolobium bilobum]
MDSSQNERGPQKESSPDQSSSNRDATPPRPQSPPAAAAQPQMMYYQPGMAYPGQYGGQPQPHHAYPPGYAPYPNDQYPHGYNYPAAPYYGVPATYPPGDGGRSFIRSFILCSCIIFTFFFIASLAMALVFHPRLPNYKVISLSVANFSTNPTLTGVWNTSIIVENPNDKLKSYFSDFKVDFIHKENIVAVSGVPDFVLDEHEQKQMDIKASSNDVANGMSFQKWDMDEMAKERDTGSIMVVLRLSSVATIKSSTMSTTSAMVLALCDGLKVVFQNNTGTGTLDDGGKPISCQPYM